MIPERDHEHELIPYNDFTRPDGIRQVWARCICGLEERRSFRLAQGTRDDWVPHDLEYRLGGVWMKPLELVRRRAIPVQECPACHGDPDPRVGRCPECLGLGVVEGDHPVGLRAPAPISDPQPPVE